MPYMDPISGGTTTPLKFKEFVEEELLVNSGILKNTIGIATAVRWLNVLGYFLSQKSALEEVILEAGHKCIFYPKFHCELNYIERYWGAAKRYARENCDYSWSGLQRVVPAALESVDTITIRRFARKAWRYMDLYRKGITGKLAEYAARKYKSHRCIPEYVLSELNEIKL